jgi:di/tricarboxylate transporter
LGIRFVLRADTQGAAGFVDSRERWPYFAFFVGVALTAFGSGYYHLRPNDHTLVWDRIPMAIGFMALVAAVVAERISVKLGARLLLPLIVVGIGSVIYWDVTQTRDHGDLRPYAIAQFGSLLILLLIVALFPPRYTRTSDLIRLTRNLRSRKGSRSRRQARLRSRSLCQRPHAETPCCGNFGLLDSAHAPAADAAQSDRGC